MKKYYKYLFLLIFGLFLFIPKNTYASEQFVNISSTNFWGRFRGGESNATFMTSKSGSGSGPESTAYSISSFDNTGSWFPFYDYIKIGLGMFYTPLSGDATYTDTVTFTFDNVDWQKDTILLTPTTYNVNNPSVFTKSIAYSNCEYIGGVNICHHAEWTIVYSFKNYNGYVELWLTADPDYVHLRRNSTISYRNWSFTGTTDNSDVIINQNQIQIDQNNNIINNQNETNNKLDDINDTLQDNNISGAETDADSLVNNPVFQDSTGLNNIISLPLDFINTIGNTCTPITLNIPFINTNVTLPCFSSVLSDKVPTIYNLLVVVINGFILYRCCLDIYGIVKNAKNPNSDRIEVLDL